MKYESVEELVKAAEEKGCKISEIVISDQCSQLENAFDDIYNKMLNSFNVMKQSVVEGKDKDIRSTSGLTGGDAYKMQEFIESGNSICGATLDSAIVMALAVSESNACMGKIVAAPTAGSCGIIPASVLSIMETKGIDERDAVKALFTASGIGMVIAKNASISGAEGGCQAECGSASAMAAAAVTEMCGGTPKMVSNACAIALKNILGLVCDPVAGLVEIPCIKRNASGAANALVAAELALAGIESAIPADEVIWAMKKIGDIMSPTLKETAEGGLAATPTGRKLCEKVFG